MEFGFCEEEQMGNKVKLRFSSSPLYKTQQLLPALNNNNNNSIWEREIINTTHQQQIDSNEETASTKQQLLMEKEHMFDKVVTPSDVGKLNRLVIPKQYAEKYFPLDSSTNEKCLLLNFEDRNGKSWRFRYSYWNSSQSYVITKGWSRFVKDKKLDAGDIVSFQRGLGDLGKDRLFIDCRTRPDVPHPSSIPLLMRPPVLPPNSFGTSTNVISPCVFYLRSQPAAASSLHPQQHMGMVEWQKQQHPIVFDSVPVVQGKAAAKRLRLFGVNMDCPITESDECDMTMAINHPSSSSQLRLYDTTPMPPFDFLNKGKASMSFDSSGI